MTLFYQTQSWSSQPQVNEETINLWKHVSEKKHWRIVQLPNGFYQTEYLDPKKENTWICLLYTSPSPRDRQKSRMPSSA